VSLREQTLENATDVQTLDFNIYTDFINQKKVWSLSYDSLDEATYDAIRGYYDRQFTTFQYPALAISYYGIDTPVRMYMNTKQVWNNCGSVENIDITLRESDQLFSDVEYLLLENGDKLYVNNTGFLTL
jgi:hypothetical protein